MSSYLVAAMIVLGAAVVFFTLPWTLPRAR